MIDYMDCHADTLTEIPEGESLWENHCNLDLRRVNAFAGKYTQIFAIWKDRREMADGNVEAQFWKLYERAVFLLREQEERLLWCRSAKDAARAHAQGKAAAFLSIEDISIMGNMAERAGELGFRFAMLCWNYENAYACGASACQKKGLTAEGKRLAGQLLRQGLVLDISHLSDSGVEDILLLTDRPVIASHSNVREVWNHPRNLQKGQIQELVRRRGLLGMNFYAPFVGGERASAEDFARHLDYALALGAEDAVALGGDFDGCGNHFMEGIEDAASVLWLWETLRLHGFDEKLLQKLFFGNANRFIMEQEAWEK